MKTFLRFALACFTLSQCFQGLSSMSTSIRRVVDLRSDTVTRPSPAMRTAMFEAEVGDDVFGDDPTVHILENKLSVMFKKESALFFPSGTMSNLAATMSWCGKRGSELILGETSHMFLYEQGGIAQLAGVLPRTIPNLQDGTIQLDLIERAVRQNNIHFPVTELIALEDTHNFCGGRVLPKGYLEAVSSFAKSRDIAVHLDGARIWNAAAASKGVLADMTTGADSISVCLSKGLGAPSGSVLLGPRDFIERARRCRKVLGGGMRQVGILAAAGLQAIADYEAGILIPDHQKARLLATAIAGISGFTVALDAVETNIVLVNVETGSDPSIVAAKLKEKGIMALPFGSRSVRLVTHRDILEEDLDSVIEAFKAVSLELWPPQVYYEEFAPTPSVSTVVAIDEIPEQPVADVVDGLIKSVASRRLITNVLRNKEIFRSDISISEFKFFVDSAQGLKVSPGDVVIRMGDSAEFFYIIESGGVDFYLDANGDYSNVVKSLSAGGFFGEIALMYDAPRAATVIASEETVLWRIHKNDFFAIQRPPDNKLGYFKTMDHSDSDGPVPTDSSGDTDTTRKSSAVKGEDTERLSNTQSDADTESAPKGRTFSPNMTAQDEDDHEILCVSGDVESCEIWDEEELQGLESGGQAVSLSEDEEPETSAVNYEAEGAADSDATEFYEEAVIHGMSLSDDGFCVLLKGVVCDRVLRVLVTPTDPMSDGLDIDQVETSEAVTLLQLLQGIDVESVLARDALAVKFAESGPGKQQYTLQRVMVDGVSKSKSFHARLLGSAASSVSTAVTTLPSPPLPVSVVPQHSFDHPVFETIVLSPHLPDPTQSILTDEIKAYPSEPSSQESSTTQLETSTIVDSQGSQVERIIADGRTVYKEVELNCAFEAVALALRHSAVVEVRSSLLQDEHFSYSLEELPSYFPKLVESGISAEEHGRFGADYDSKSEMERLQRRLFEAIRQGNSAKTDSIKRQLEFYSHIEGRSVLVLPPPHLFLAPDIVAPSLPSEVVQSDSPSGTADPSDSNLSTSEEAFEISGSEPVRQKSIFDGFSLPFHFDSQKKELKKLEDEQLDQQDTLSNVDDNVPNENQNDGLGQQLSSIYSDDERIDSWNWHLKS